MNVNCMAVPNATSRDFGMTEPISTCARFFSQRLDGDKTWQETKDACKDAGDAKIAVPSGSDENVFLHDLALQYNGNIWIGVRENVSSGTCAVRQSLQGEDQDCSIATCNRFRNRTQGIGCMSRGAGTTPTGTARTSLKRK